MQKVFASDFDGTLYFCQAPEAEKLPAANVEAIRRYQQSGHIFGLCTGRQVGGVTPFITGWVEPDFYITSSGANIVGRAMEPIFKRGIDRAAAVAIVRQMNPRGCRLTLDIEGEIFAFSETDSPGFYHVISGVDDAPAGLIHQLSIQTEAPEDAAAVAASINREFGDYVEAFRNGVKVDVAPKGCSKGKGVERLRKYYRGQYGSIRLYGIGDSIDDLPLLRAADVSYTFPYAPQEVQDAADFVVPTIVDALAHSAME